MSLNNASRNSENLIKSRAFPAHTSRIAIQSQISYPKQNLLWSYGQLPSSYLSVGNAITDVGNALTEPFAMPIHQPRSPTTPYCPVEFNGVHNNMTNSQLSMGSGSWAARQIMTPNCNPRVGTIGQKAQPNPNVTPKSDKAALELAKFKKLIPELVPQQLQSKRIVKTKSYVSRRAELHSLNKPVASYVPTILSIWKPIDFKEHFKLLKLRKKQNYLKKLILKDNRTVKMKRYCTTPLKYLKTIEQRSDRWWIVTDTKVLLDDMYFILRLLTSDSECRMLMPYEVLHDLTAMTAKSMVTWIKWPARNLVKFIVKHCGTSEPINYQGAVEAEDLLDHPYATDAVLNTCFQLQERYYYVVLITDDPIRQTKAKSAAIPCFTLNDVRNVTQASYANCRDMDMQITIKFQ